MAVFVQGDQIVGYLDGEPVVALQAQFGTAGRVGLYSVESKASFDDLKVTSLEGLPSPTGIEQAQIRGFWFSDSFNLQSTWWYHFNASTGKPSPWAFSEGGCSIAFEDDAERVCEFTRYRMSDFRLHLNVSVGEPEEESMFGVIFRKNGNRYLKLELDHDDGEIRLVSVNGKRRKVLKKEDLGSEFFDNSNVLRLKVQGNRVLCESYELPLLEYEGKDLLNEPGRIAFTASQVRLVLHKMTVSSANEEAEESDE